VSRAAIETDLYWLLFAAALLALAFWEVSRPWRSVPEQLARRWGNHALLFGISSACSTVISRATLPVIAIVVANSRFGLLNRHGLPLSMRWILGFLLIDLLRYALHRAFHSVPLFWRMHQVHHSDPTLDLSTGIRNHPFEAVVVQVPVALLVVILAPPPTAMLATEMVALLSSFFTHANGNLPGWLERGLGWVLVTPNIHRIHHSEQIGEQNANFGEILPWWDRMFRTYREAPEAGFDAMRIGLKEAQGSRSASLRYLLLEPFRRPPASDGLQDGERALLAQTRLGE
jgi:sterol desaturase/sphingolipid hydroxylase (fatty acid hydroxylase superfamily)